MGIIRDFIYADSHTDNVGRDTQFMCILSFMKGRVASVFSVRGGVEVKYRTHVDTFVSNGGTCALYTYRYWPTMLKVLRRWLKLRFMPQNLEPPVKNL